MWITGDFNFPNINWDLNSVVSNAYPLELCNMLLDTFSIFGLTQLIHLQGETIYLIYLLQTDPD